MSSNSNALSNASNDANQNMSPAPAGSPTSSCGDADGSNSPSNQTSSPSKTHWIAIQLVDERGHAVPNEDFRITLPDQTLIEGCLDKHGRAKISGIDPGPCQVSFPKIDSSEWKHK